MADTTVDPSTATGGGDNYITEDPEANANATGPKYLALHVPNFSGNLHSYLCLGADSTWREDSTTTGTPTSVYGDVLAGLVQGFCDDDRVRGQTSTPANALPPGESVDDQGVTPANLDENAAQSQTSMQAESAQLHSKGGWRDHSDGNRITTTYGDKVEVIRGNYKLLVLGRQDQVPFTTAPGQTVPSVSQWADSEVAGWDISGGLVSTDQASLMYPPSAGAYNNSSGGNASGQELLNTQYTWLQDSDGNWGWTMQTVTGTYGPRPNQGNGRIVSYTWVDERYSYVGSGNPTPAAASSSTVNPDGDPNLQSNRRPAKTLIDRQWGENIQTELNAKQATAPGSAVPGFAPGKPTLISTWASDGDTYINTSASQWLTSTTAPPRRVCRTTLAVMRWPGSRSWGTRRTRLAACCSAPSQVR